MAQEVPTPASLIAEACAAFEKRFDMKPTIGAKAPGRVNLIGEHTDYNGGFVFPMALPMITVIVGAPTETGVCRVETLSSGIDGPTYLEFPINKLEAGLPKWCNYVKGVAANMPGKVSSFDAVIISSVPLGGGVSSSASLEVATYTFLEQMEGVDSTVPDIKKILACQKAEHDFAGMPCGIMDQFVSLTGSEGHAVLLDCRAQAANLIPLADPSVLFLISNSNVKHELTGSEYPTRRRQCHSAAEKLGYQTLREANTKDLERVGEKLDEETMKRVRHVVTETARTKEAAGALESGDYDRFGQLMLESHASLRDDFEVSCKELDQLVEFAMELKGQGVYGSRMTGGGFGGCTVSLIDAKAVDKVVEHVDKRYATTGHRATFYVCHPAAGATKINLHRDQEDE